MMKTTVSALLVAGAVLLQAAVVNRLPLPWGLAPDLVLLAVAGVALWSSTTTAAVSGFAAGLAVDTLPPADHEIGRSALLLCLAGYLLAAIRDSEVHRGLGPYLAAAVAALGVAGGFAVIGLVLGDPRSVLPEALWAVLGSTGMTVLVSPAVLGPVTWVMRRLSHHSRGDLPAPWLAANGGVR
ncbi:rod shape-determining protein MreD [Streptomonospora litoralis]|uniref:Uncharacterized protein n=1 Tax=Streptomonospora litoralis TaxID=2498135 RepID=A0A4P6Q4Y9_9ACTN|nr:rod shape-determining protein MreD [Streptomonospora litoralis]QBI55340.1 hypothetical protein EKD16_17870 [Streptomonospora litoralis]